MSNTHQQVNESAALPTAMQLKEWHLPKAPDRYTQQDSDRHVALLAKQDDFETVMLASMGISAKAITKRNGYSVGQVYYRLKKAGVKIQDYRNGTSPFAQMVVEQIGRKAAQQVIGRVRGILSA